MERCYPDPIYRTRVRNYMDSLADGWRDFVMTTRAGERIETSWSNVRLSDDTRVGIGLDVRGSGSAPRPSASGRTHRPRRRAGPRTSSSRCSATSCATRSAPSPTALHVIELCGPLDERSGEARAIIGRQVGHLVRLVDDLLDVTRLATGKISLSLRRSTSWRWRGAR